MARSSWFIRFRSTSPNGPSTTCSQEAPSRCWGEIYRRNSYLSEDGYHVYSDYDIAPSLVMMDKGRRAGRPSVGSPLVVQVYGGDLMIGSTHVTVVNDSLTGWKDGAEMLLFLSAADVRTGRRVLYGESAGAFEIEASGTLRSVIKRGAVNRAIHGAQRSTVVGHIHEKLKR